MEMTKKQLSNKLWYERNKEIKKLKTAKYHKRRPLEDENFRLARNLRKRLRTSLKLNFKSGSAIGDLGCTIDELKLYLQSKFQEGMSWNNYGRYGWHIDHIVPLSKFDLTDREQLKTACHYTNLQPLWWNDNLRKGNNG